MPGFDKKGPMGNGPMTGRGRGLCGSQNIGNDQKTRQNANLESGIGNVGRQNPGPEFGYNCRQRMGQGFGFGGGQNMRQGFGKMRANKRFGRS